MFDFFQYSFMIRALVAGIIVATILPVLGSFLVARRYSLIADSLAHVSLAGVGAGLLLGTTPILVAIPVAVVGALFLEYLRQNKRMSGDTSLAILMSGGLAVAIVLSGLSGGRTDFNTYLFGSITTTSWQDVRLLLAAHVIIALFIISRYHALLHIAFDEDSARISGHKVTILNYILTAMTAVMVVLCLRIVGGLLISALLVIPVVTAGGLANSFARTILFAVLIALFGVIVGLLVAFYAGIAAGGAIVLVTLSLFAGSLLFRRT